MRPGDLLRPGARLWLRQWREALVGGAVAALGLWWIATEPGLLRWVGFALALGGGAVAREGALRARRPQGGGGVGIVQVTERQITYLSGHGGGAVSLDILSEVAVVREDTGAAVWHLSDIEGRRIDVPSDAEGAGVVFDALAPLIPQDTMLDALARPERGREVLWSRGPLRLG